jgi:23S rRNA pseudouridine2605 synthase
MALRKRSIEKSRDNSKKKNTFSNKPKRAIRSTNLRNSEKDSFKEDKKSETLIRNSDSKPANRYARKETSENRFSQNKFSSDRKSSVRTPFKKSPGFNRKPKAEKIYSSVRGKNTSRGYNANTDDRNESDRPIKRFSKSDIERPSEFKKGNLYKIRNSDGNDKPVKRFAKNASESLSEIKREYVSKGRSKSGDRTERIRPLKNFTKRDSDKRLSNFKKESNSKPFNRKGADEKENRNPSFRSPRSADKPSPDYKKNQKDYKSDLILTEQKKFSKSKTFKKVANIKIEKHDDLVRLNRYVSNAGICSRREADKLISTGLVSVNGTVVIEMGYQVKNSDDVRFNGQRLSREKRVYILMNKPKDAITTLDDPDGRNTIMDILGNEISERIYPIGRLDRNTTGVLLLTNDGELAQRLMHPKYEVEKVYKATLNKAFSGEDFWTLTNGVELEDGFIKPDELAYPDQKNKQEVGVLIHSGRNRIIHRMFEHLGYTLDRLDRVSYGGFAKTGLKRGGWRHLSEKEIDQLKRLSKESKQNKKL